MKKWFLLISFALVFLKNAPVYALLAPALQFDTEDYIKHFSYDTDYKVKLNTHFTYKITCASDIIGTVSGDAENIKINDIKDDRGSEITDMKSILLKTKYEAYSYLRLYLANGEIEDIVLNVNPIHKDAVNLTLGLCTITQEGA